MCLCLRFFWTVLHNLVIRMVNDIVDTYYNGCCHENNQECNEINQTVDDYVVMNDPQNEIKRLQTEDIENEYYFRAVDRMTAEEILTNRVDGSCLVRPYKAIDTCIKYIVSVYAQNNFFHLYIRKINGIDKFGIGLEKPLEKLFNTPNDIINHYRLNKLLCTNKIISISLVLVPIS